MQRQCATCKQWKDEEDFNWRFKTLGIRHPTCRECHKPFRKNWYEKSKDRHLQQVQERKRAAREVAREYAWAYLESHPCSKCGESDASVLEFHHHGRKSMALSRMIGDGSLSQLFKQKLINATFCVLTVTDA